MFVGLDQFGQTAHHLHQDFTSKNSNADLEEPFWVCKKEAEYLSGVCVKGFDVFFEGSVSRVSTGKLWFWGEDPT